jgi:hypothetical protein
MNFLQITHITVIWVKNSDLEMDIFAALSSEFATQFVASSTLKWGAMFDIFKGKC